MSCGGTKCKKRDTCKRYMCNDTSIDAYYDLSVEGSGGYNMPDTYMCGDLGNYARYDEIPPEPVHIEELNLTDQKSIDALQLFYNLEIEVNKLGETIYNTDGNLKDLIEIITILAKHINK